MTDKKRILKLCSMLFAVQTVFGLSNIYELKSNNDRLATNLDNARTELFKTRDENSKYRFADTITTSTALVNNHSLTHSLSIQEKAKIALRFFDAILKQENPEKENLCNIQFEDNKIVNTFSLKDNLYNTTCSKLYSCSSTVLAGINVMETDTVSKSIPTTPHNAWVAMLVDDVNNGVSPKEGKKTAERILNLLKDRNAVSSTFSISGNLLGQYNQIIQDKLFGNVRSI